MGRDGSIVFLMKVMNIFCKKYIKMENKEQDFINRYKNVQESIVKAMDKALERAIGMMSENIERANRGESLAYTEDQFMKLIQDNGITYNDVIQRGWI